MIEVIGGNLFQWDTGRVAQVNTDADIHEVHFTTKDMTYAYVVSTYEKDGAVYCEIPNILLQQEKSLICYEVTTTDGGEMTVAETTLALHKRNKPQDYAYTQDELKNFDRLAALIPTDEHINGLIYTKLDENIPTKLSQLTDDIGAGGAKITSVNGILPDENGNVEVQAGVQPDWNQNDSTAADYIKNRPCYQVFVENELVNGAFGFSYNSNYGLFTNQHEINFYLEEGKKYKVVFDGVEYETVCQLFMGQYLYIGAPELLDFSLGDPSVPFTCVEIMNNFMFGTLLTDETHDIVIKGIECDYVKLPEYYIPAMGSVILNSSTADSTKKFKITVDDSGTLTATEVS